MFNRRPVVAAILAVGLASSTMAVAQSVSAKPNKVSLCHYDADTDSYKLISVSGNGNAVNAHLAHGDGRPGDPVPTMEGSTFDDDCVPVADEMILAVAYTDTDDDGGAYDPDVDVLIAKVVDDGDGLPSTGDTIVMQQYPLDLDATAFGSFTTTTHTGTLEFATAELLRYSGSGGTFGFLVRDIGEAYEETGESPTRTLIQDGLGIQGGPNVDILQVDSGSPSAPNTEVPETIASTTQDDLFIDVEFYFTP